MGDNKPIVVVGTHADKIIEKKQNPNVVMQELEDTLKKNTELHGCGIKKFIPVSMSTGFGVNDLKSCLVELALKDPQIGVLNVKVPVPLLAMQRHMQYLVQQNSKKDEKTIHYMIWADFEAVCTSKHIQTILLIIVIFDPCVQIPQSQLRNYAQKLHDMGSIVWQDAPIVNQIVCIIVITTSVLLAT